MTTLLKPTQQLLRRAALLRRVLPGLTTNVRVPSLDLISTYAVCFYLPPNLIQIEHEALVFVSQDPANCAEHILKVLRKAYSKPVLEGL